MVLGLATVAIQSCKRPVCLNGSEGRKEAGEEVSSEAVLARQARKQKPPSCVVSKITRDLAEGKRPSEVQSKPALSQLIAAASRALIQSPEETLRKEKETSKNSKNGTSSCTLSL